MTGKCPYTILKSVFEHGVMSLELPSLITVPDFIHNVKKKFACGYADYISLRNWIQYLKYMVYVVTDVSSYTHINNIKI